MFLSRQVGSTFATIVIPVLGSLAWAGSLESPCRAADLIRSTRSGPWSAATTWEDGKLPGAGARVQVRPGHRVVYDLSSDQVVRSIHVAGTLTFAPDKDTRLAVGLIKIQRGEDASEDGFNCDAHVPAAEPGQPMPALEVG